MANVQSPFGLALAETLSGSSFNAKLRRYYIPAADGSAYYVGDAVKSTATVGADANGVVAIAKITNGTDTPRGFIVSIEQAVGGGSMQGLNLDTTQVSIPASKTRDYYVLVCDDPDAVFMVQGDGTATNQVATKASYNCTLTIAAPSPASYPVSATCVNSASINTTNTLTVRLMGLAPIPGNTLGAYATYLAKWNLHELAFGVTAN